MVVDGRLHYLRRGRVAHVPALAAECEQLSALLTPHDEVHALALRLTLLYAEGKWEELAALTTRALQSVEVNESTPCQFNWRSLLVCALGLTHRGEGRDARRLEETALASAEVAGPPEREPALLRLALVRGDLDEAARVLSLLPRVATRSPSTTPRRGWMRSPHWGPQGCRGGGCALSRRRELHLSLRTPRARGRSRRCEPHRGSGRAVRRSRPRPACRGDEGLAWQGQGRRLANPGELALTRTRPN
jgi:hypothetical protein